MKCRLCFTENIPRFLNLGFHPISDGFLTEVQLHHMEITYPLEVFYCEKCGLVQLGYVVSQDILFGDDYPYTTGTNAAGVEHFKQFAEETVERFRLKNDFIVDIGSNDGTLLQWFEYTGCKVCGVEPVRTIKSKVDKVPGFWNIAVANLLHCQHGKAKVITATNVFAHCPDLHGFMKGIDILLDDKGVFIIESPYLLDLIDNLEYDTIYHEHLSVLAVRPLKYLLDQYNMEIFDIKRVDFHGGSLRYFISRKYADHNWHPISSGVNEGIELEKREIDLVKLKNFAYKVAEARDNLIWYLLSLKRSGKSVAGVCASAKGNTLLNYCGIDLPYITEKSELKIGKYSPGRHIPIVPDERLIEEQPDYALLLACNFKGSIPKILRDKGYKGKFILPWPSPHTETMLDHV